MECWVKTVRDSDKLQKYRLARVDNNPEPCPAATRDKVRWAAWRGGVNPKEKVR